MGRPENYLGIAARAGKVAAGRKAAEMALRRGRGRLVLLAKECGKDVRRHFVRLAETFGVPVIRTDLDLGRAIGRPGKVVAVVTDADLAGQVIASIGEKEVEV
ncbi:MAG TPA: hypothetical protein EYP61_02570 [Candidatus Latescibacteria bacterium]|nr:hypothetical protein [Candidatus Latescibacterota bacterium]